MLKGRPSPRARGRQTQQKRRISSWTTMITRAGGMEARGMRRGAQNSTSTQEQLDHFFLARQELSSVVVCLVQLDVVRLLTDGARPAADQLRALREARDAHEGCPRARRRLRHHREAEREGGVEGVDIPGHDREAPGYASAAQHPEILRRERTVLLRRILD